MSIRRRQARGQVRCAFHSLPAVVEAYMDWICRVLTRRSERGTPSGQSRGVAGAMRRRRVVGASFEDKEGHVSASISSWAIHHLQASLRRLLGRPASLVLSYRVVVSKATFCNGYWMRCASGRGWREDESRPKRDEGRGRALRACGACRRRTGHRATSASRPVRGA